MKKTLLLLISSSLTCMAMAQEPADALRSSWYSQGASARVLAVGGAMGSLGGDISATFVNPAGLGFYRTGDFVLGPAFNFGKTKASYLSRDEKDKTNRFTWGTTGLVIGGGNNSGNGIRSGALGIAFNRTADFNSNVLYRGLNTQSSYTQKYLEEIRNSGTKDGNDVANNFPYGTSLAFNSYLIDTVGGGTNGNFQFQSRAANLLPTGLYQQNIIQSKGGINEFAIGLAANSNDKIYFGASLGVPIMYFDRTIEFLEADATENTTNKFNYALIKENLVTKGAGINVKAGVIFKPQEFWRIGLAIHSPTYYTLTDQNEASIEADVENPRGVLVAKSTDLTGGSPSEFKYDMVTPYKVIGSISYVIREIEDVRKQRGFLTADVEYINYKAASFQPNEENNNDQSTKDYLKSLNRAIDNAYKGAFNFRVGGELKFTTVMVRLGAAYYGNPYKDIHGEKGSKLNLSGGLGYRNKGFFIDLAYIYAITRDVNFPYRLQYTAYSGANLRSQMGNAVATVGFKF